MRRHRVLAVVAATVTGLILGGCGEPETERVSSETLDGTGVVHYDTTAEQTGRIRVDAVTEIAQTVPEPWRSRGYLVIGGTAGSNPPLNFFAEDNTTAIGIERDLGILIADVLGLEYRPDVSSWENVFVGLDSGRLDLALSNITVTEERKDKYDFATYRKNLMSFETRKGSGLTIDGPEDISGKKIATGSGTIQEDLLLRWNAENIAAGREPAEILYFQDAHQYYLAVESGRIDAYLGPNPTARYHVAVSPNSVIAGTVNPGEVVEAEVGATTKKGSGLAAPVAAALNHAIETGTYQQVLDRWGVGSEAVTTSQINPPGIPRQQR